MSTLDRRIVFYCLMVVGVVLAIGWLWLFVISKDGDRKRRHLRLYVVICAAWFTVFTFLPDTTIGSRLAVIALIAFGTWKYLRTVRICPECSSLNFRRHWFTPPAECSNCGTSLTNSDKPDW